jgi:hypothetical protein
MTEVKHCGWGMTMGRPMCGAERGCHASMLDRKITCLRCLGVLAKQAAREVVLTTRSLEASRKEHTRYLGQIAKVRASRG